MVASVVAAASLVLLAGASFAQAPAGTFAVASVKLSPRPVGKDYRSEILVEPSRLSGRNVDLKSLIVEAYHLQPHQVTGPNWLDADEYEIDARADGPAGRAQLDRMLQTLLADRFHLAAHRETKELRVYALTVDKRGSKLHPAKEVDSAPRNRAVSGPGNFHGDLGQFAALLSIQLTIPTVPDPSRPGIAAGSPVPVVDETGLSGIYDISVDVRPDPGGDAFTVWQRVLLDQLGLRLESRKAPVEILVVDRVERIPTAN